MGQRGPAPAPTALKLVKGERKDRINTAEPRARTGRPPCPPWLSAEAKKVWRYTVAELEAMGVLTRADRDALTVYCEAVVHHAKACQLADASGVLIKGRKDAVVKNPAMQVVRDTAQTIRAMAQEFGLTPSARSQIIVPGVSDATRGAERLLS